MNVFGQRTQSGEAVADAGKGSHTRIYLGDRLATLKDRNKEIGPGLLRAMCRQLGIDPKGLT